VLRGTVALDGRELWTAGAFALAAGAVLPALPGDAGLPCPLRTVTGVPCPLCGMTTSVEAAVHLHPVDALAANPGGLALVVAALALLVARPRRIRVPALAAPTVLAALWLFELHRFSIL
jgi:Protein of unknown function (DUF2752)